MLGQEISAMKVAQVENKPDSEAGSSWSRSNPNHEIPYDSEISEAMQRFDRLENNRYQTLLQVWDDLNINEPRSESKNAARERWKTLLAGWEKDQKSVSSESKSAFASLTLT